MYENYGSYKPLQSTNIKKIKQEHAFLKFKKKMYSKEKEIQSKFRKARNSVIPRITTKAPLITRTCSPISQDRSIDEVSVSSPTSPMIR